MKVLTGLGRKFILTLMCVVLLSIAYIGSAYIPQLQSGFSEFAMGLGGLLGIYCGGNVGNKLITKQVPHKSNEMEGF